MKRLTFVAVLAVICCGAAVAAMVPEAHAATHEIAANSMQFLMSGIDPTCWAAGGLVTSKVLRDLQGKKSAVTKLARELQDKAHAEDRDFTEEENKTFEGYAAQIGTLNNRIERETVLVVEEAAGAAVPAGSGARVTENVELDPKRGFAHAGEYFKAVHQAGLRGGEVDERLLIGAAAPATFGNEGSGQDGGFLVPPEFSRSIWMHSLGEDSLIPLTDNTEVTGNSMVFPKDETTPWGTDGITVAWQGEAAAATPTKPKFGVNVMRLYKLMGLVPMSDELLADANALNSYLPKKLGVKIRWKANEAILWGSGAGLPMGALQGNAAVVQAKDAAQATLTLSLLNCANMISRLPPGSYANAIWVINNNVLPALFTLSLGNYPVYLPAGAPVGGAQLNPYGTLLGRPIVVSQHAKSFTSQGDVNLVDLSYYRTITKAGGVETASSMHLYFDADVTAFRAIFRMDGQPAIVNPINPANGSTTLSPFVQLQAR